MKTHTILETYGLPKQIDVMIERTPEGPYFVQFINGVEGFTEASTASELILNVTDAILSSHLVPKKDLSQIDIAYIPKIFPSNALDVKKIKNTFYAVSFTEIYQAKYTFIDIKNLKDITPSHSYLHTHQYTHAQ